MALVHRYMLDAEEAEARVREAVEKTKNEAHRRSQSAAPTTAELQARRETERARRETERARRESERARRRTEQREREARELELLAGSTTNHQEVDELASEEALRAAWAGVRHVGNGFAVEDATWNEPRPSPRPITKEERRSAKEAARLLAALEKREARERKALAKVAAKRRLTGSYRS